MISFIQNLHIGNALRLFIDPPDGAIRWRILRKSVNAFSGPTDPSALVAYEGDEKIFTDTESLKNEQPAYYKPYWTADGATWIAGDVNFNTPTADYVDDTPDVLGILRTRIEQGLLVEVPFLRER